METLPETSEPSPAPVVVADAAGSSPVAPAAPAGNTTPAPVSNEQFFSFKPDTSLFAQEGGEAAPPPATGTTTGDIGGMGSFQDKTVSAGEKQYTGEPFSFDFKDIDIKDLFRFIADISGLNVILDPGVRGSVTLKLTEVLKPRRHRLSTLRW
jgi:type IV pilus assembly protein PilQ